MKEIDKPIPCSDLRIDTSKFVCDNAPVFSNGDRIRKLREAKGWTQKDLAREAGIHNQTVSRVEHDKPAEVETFQQIAKALGVSPGYILPKAGAVDSGWVTGNEAEEIDDDVTTGYKPNDIPVIAEGDASPEPNLFWEGNELRSDVEERISRPFDVRDPRAYAVKVRGDSMVPRYKPGECLVVSPNLAVQDGDEVYVALLSGERLLKVARRADGGWILESENRAYPARFVKKEEVGTMHPILWIRPKRRRR